MRTLYHHMLMPSCRAVRIMLREKNIKFSLAEEPFWERRVSLFHKNPAGELPVLEDENGLVVCGSYSLYEYIEEQYPAISLMGSSIEERANVRRIIAWFDEKFAREVTEYVLQEKIFKRLMGYGEPDSNIIRSGKRNILHHLDYIAHLLNDQTWLAGEHLTMADIVAAAHLSALDYLGDVPWEHHLNAKEWYALMKSRPSMHVILQDRMNGRPPPEYYGDPDF